MSSSRPHLLASEVFGTVKIFPFVYKDAQFVTSYASIISDQVNKLASTWHNAHQYEGYLDSPCPYPIQPAVRWLAHINSFDRDQYY